MKSEWITREIDSIHHKFAEWRAKSHALGPDFTSLVEGAIRDVSRTIDELVVAYEDVERTNNDLIETSMISKLEYQRYKDLFENAPLGYLILDQAGIIQICNNTASQLLQAPKDLLVGQSLLEMIEEADNPRLKSLLRHNQKSWAADNIEFHLKRGHPVWDGVVLRIAGLSSPRQEPSEIWISIHDVSE